MVYNPHGKYVFLENYVLAELGQTEIKNWQRQVLLCMARAIPVEFDVAATRDEKDAFFSAAEAAEQTWNNSEVLIESRKGRGA